MDRRKPTKPGTKVGLKLTAAERKLILDDLTSMDDDYVQVIRDTPANQPVQFTLDEWEDIGGHIAAEANHTDDRKLGKKLDAIFNKVQRILDIHTDEESRTTLKTSSATVYQFKITLKGIKPPIWRRIQTKDCTLDRLHEHIQTAMGWTNSHLHRFEINGVGYGDPELLSEGWLDEKPPVNSLRVKISKIVPKDGKRFQFDYEYDFGDGWEHEILFEGCLRAEKGTRYPLCLEGQRACPPEDVGGIYGYQEYLEAMVDPDHERHEEFMEWRGPFDPEEFDATAATKAMRTGLPNWRGKE